MKSYLAACLLIASLLVPGLWAQAGECFDPTVGSVETYLLKGLEYAKGFDIGAVRYWTRFGGLFFSEEMEELGIWKVTLNHKGAENIEVCGGQNDVIWARLEMEFKNGHRMVLVMRDRTGKPDIVWDGAYVGEPCHLGGLNCNCPADCDGNEQDVADCEEVGFSDLATVYPICLNRGWGTTLPVVAAEISGGQLCHQFPVIPRITGTVTVHFSDR